MKKSVFFLPFTSCLFCLSILLNAINCQCLHPRVTNYNYNAPRLPSQTPNTPREVPPIKPKHTISSKAPMASEGKPVLLLSNLSGNDIMLDEEQINLRLINQGNQALQLNAIKTVITLHATQNFSQQSVTAGRILVYNKSGEVLNQSGTRELSLLLIDILQVDQLEPGMAVNLCLSLVDRDQVVSTKITLQIKDPQDNVLAENTTLCKFNPPIGPLPGKSRIDPQLDFTKVLVKDDMLELPIEFANNGDHPIDLKKADYQLEIVDQISGKQELQVVCLGENVRIHQENAILRPGQTIKLTLNDFNIDSCNLIRTLKKPNLQCNFVILTKATRENIGTDTKSLQFNDISCTSEVAVEVVKHTISIIETEANTAILQCNIKLTNKSGYVININPSKVSYSCTVSLVEGSILNHKTFTGLALMGDESKLLFARQTYTLPAIELPLAGYNKQEIKKLLEWAKLDIKAAINL
jgi:hypothetical protein